MKPFNVRKDMLDSISDLILIKQELDYMRMLERLLKLAVSVRQSQLVAFYCLTSGSKPSSVAHVLLWIFPLPAKCHWGSLTIWRSRFLLRLVVRRFHLTWRFLRVCKLGTPKPFRNSGQTGTFPYTNGPVGTTAQTMLTFHDYQL